MKKKKDNTETNNIVNEPAAAYQTQKNIANKTPLFVQQDYKTGMEQYKKGECISIEELMETLQI